MKAFAVLAALALTGSCAGREAPEPTPAAQPDPTPGASREACCAECLGGASQDAAAMDLSLVPCVDYATHIVNGAPSVSAACAAWFAETPLMVQDCR